MILTHSEYDDCMTIINLSKGLLNCKHEYNSPDYVNCRIELDKEENYIMFQLDASLDVLAPVKHYTFIAHGQHVKFEKNT